MAAIRRRSVLGLAVLLAAASAAADAAVSTGGPCASADRLTTRFTIPLTQAAGHSVEISRARPESAPGGGCGDPVTGTSVSDWNEGVALGGIIGGAVGFVGGTLAGGGWQQTPGWGVVVASGVGATVGAAGGTWAVGMASRENGQWGWTLLGASIGSLVAVPLFWHYQEGLTWDDDRMKAVLAAAVTLPAAGAVIGYHLSRRSPEFGDRFFDRLDYPSVALRPSTRRLAPPALDARLFSVRL